MSPKPRHAPNAGWDAKSLVTPHQQADKAQRVQTMFDAIAPTYERVNAVASLGQDRGWRKKAIAAADVRAGDVVLDICCGTGDMVRSLAAQHPAPKLVIGLDFSANMLACGHYDPGTCPVQLIRADALKLPFDNESVDVITCAFGIRNFQDLQTGLSEMGRIARPGARVVLLEFTNPENAIIRWGHQLYTQMILPRIATFLSRDQTRAYQYLPKSIQSFETRRTISRRLQDAGFPKVSQQLLNLGSVVIFRAEKLTE